MNPAGQLLHICSQRKGGGRPCLLKRLSKFCFWLHYCNYCQVKINDSLKLTPSENSQYKINQYFCELQNTYKWKVCKMEQINTLKKYEKIAAPNSGNLQRFNKYVYYVRPKVIYFFSGLVKFRIDRRTG